jgi:tetratricopeptide (TPR) repeat protein
LRAQLGGPRDGALLRFSLGTALLSNGDACGAIAAFREAVGFDATYSAAWKMLGKALADHGDTDGAVDAYRHGLVVARSAAASRSRRKSVCFAQAPEDRGINAASNCRRYRSSVLGAGGAAFVAFGLAFSSCRSRPCEKSEERDQVHFPYRR